VADCIARENRPLGSGPSIRAELAKTGPLSVTVPAKKYPPVTPSRLRLNEKSGLDYCSKTKTAGFASLSETTANFDGETT
jgi:hypothetical protein